MIRFVSDGTIEEKILLLQERKQCTFDSGSTKFEFVFAFPFVIPLTEHRGRKQNRSKPKAFDCCQHVLANQIFVMFWFRFSFCSVGCASGTVAGCNESLLKLTSDDIQMLFRD